MACLVTRTQAVTVDQDHSDIERILKPWRHCAGAFVTVGHPPDGVTPANFQDVVVGSVAGEPRVQGDIITGDLLVGDKEALKRLDAGVLTSCQHWLFFCLGP